jgi:hypothetical protein
MWLGCADAGYLLGHGWTFYVHEDSQDAVRDAIERIQGGQLMATVTILLRSAGVTIRTAVNFFAWHGTSHGNRRRVVIVRMERTAVGADANVERYQRGANGNT